MNFKQNETAQKLNGSYYTPRWLSDFICRWILEIHPHNILEPSCGDGVFFDSLKSLNNNNISITGFDIDINAIQISMSKLVNSNFHYSINNADFIEWSLHNLISNNATTFDAIIGNPPFIRYQYMEKIIQDRAQELFRILGLKFSKHTNAWIPFIMASIKFLTPGGRLGMIIPSEILHVLYAKGLRDYLLDNCSRILLIDPEDIWFDGTLQGAMILLAEKKVTPNMPTDGVAIYHTRGTTFTQTSPAIIFNNADYMSGPFLQNKWTYALLTSEERDLYRHLSMNPHVFTFNQLANVDVGIVTGANNFFLVNNQTVEEYNLSDICHPMFGRSEHCPGIIYDVEQHIHNASKGIPTNFLYFEDETAEMFYSDYIQKGVDEKLPSRYKCKIRTPWYKVPSVYASPISMLKRSNGMPRLILNSLNAYTTDTAYRITPNETIDAVSMVRCFLNSLTALSAELEGRHYGGGVLELIPSEIERLLVPYITDTFSDIHLLNNFVKEHTPPEVLEIQDSLLFPLLGLTVNEIRTLQSALARLRNRRQRIENPEV